MGLGGGHMMRIPDQIVFGLFRLGDRHSGLQMGVFGSVELLDEISDNGERITELGDSPGHNSGDVHSIYGAEIFGVHTINERLIRTSQNQRC